MSLPIILVSGLVGILLGMFLPNVTVSILALILGVAVCATVLIVFGLSFLILPISILFSLLIPNSIISGFLIGMICVLLAIAQNRFGAIVRLILAAVGISFLINSGRGAYKNRVDDLMNIKYKWWKQEKDKNKVKVYGKQWRITNRGLYEDSYADESTIDAPKAQ